MKNYVSFCNEYQCECACFGDPTHCDFVISDDSLGEYRQKEIEAMKESGDV